MTSGIDTVMVELWRTLQDLPECDRAIMAGRLIRMSQDLLGPIYWPITLKALVAIDKPGACCESEV